jgi:hypothetical protein
VAILRDNLGFNECRELNWCGRYGKEEEGRRGGAQEIFSRGGAKRG